MRNEQLEYGWSNAHETCAHAYLLPAITQALPQGRPLRVLDLGCGNGFTAGYLASLGHEVVGVDASSDGIELARAAHPTVRFHVASVYDDGFADVVGNDYCVVIASEVIEHLYRPRVLLRRA